MLLFILCDLAGDDTLHVRDVAFQWGSTIRAVTNRPYPCGTTSTVPGETKSPHKPSSHVKAWHIRCRYDKQAGHYKKTFLITNKIKYNALML